MGNNSRLIKRLKWSWHQLATEAKALVVDSLQWNMEKHRGLPPLTKRGAGFMGINPSVRQLVADGLLAQPVANLDDESPERGPSRSATRGGKAPSSRVAVVATSTAGSSNRRRPNPSRGVGGGSRAAV